MPFRLRTGLVEKPEEHRCNSIGYHVQSGNADDFLSLDFGLESFNVLDEREKLRRYRSFLYEKGAKQTEKGLQIDEQTLEKERGRDFQLSRADKFSYRTRYFSDSGIIGSKDLVSKNDLIFKHFFQTIHLKVPNAEPEDYDRM